MPRFFTHYWTNQRWNERRARGEGALLRHIASTRFIRRGVRPGDQIYVVTVLRGELYLIGKLAVGSIVDAEAAAAWLGTTPDRLWAEAEQILASAATPMAFDRRVPPSVTERLRFAAAGEPRAPVFRSAGELDGQTLRSPRELTAASARLLDGLLPAMQPIE